MPELPNQPSPDWPTALDEAPHAQLEQIRDAIDSCGAGRTTRHVHVNPRFKWRLFSDGKCHRARPGQSTESKRTLGREHLIRGIITRLARRPTLHLASPPTRKPEKKRAIRREAQ